MAEKKPNKSYNTLRCRVRVYKKERAVAIEFTTTEKETIFFAMSGEGLLTLSDTIELAIEKVPEIREWHSRTVN